ncbi:FUSC family protein (plasmid) [Rhodococcus erythropolis]|uniref:FUSC family protein n=1 Tax=Rhodococcus erythropolis TaxID=1833 RepID=UPI00406BBBA8
MSISVPLLAGHLLGNPISGVVVALGSLWAVVHDIGPSHWTRARRIMIAGTASAIGLGVGQWAVRMDNFAVIATSLTLIAVVAGVINYNGTTGSVAGMQVLLGAVVGSGFVLQGPLWLAPLELLGGTAFVLAMLGLSWRRGNHLAEQLALTDSFAASFRLLTAIGTESAPRLRRSQTQALDNAHRVLSRYGRAASARGGTPHAEHAISILHIVSELASIAAALAHEANPLPTSILALARTLPTRLEIPPPPRDTEIDPLTQRPTVAVDTPAFWALESLLNDAESRKPRRHSMVSVNNASVSRVTRSQSAAVLSGSILAALTIADLFHGPRAYWLPLAVAFIYKPELAPIPNRAVKRCVGTALGVCVAALAAATGYSTYPSIAVVAVCSVLLALAVASSYVVGTLALTAIVFVFVDFLGEHENLLTTRILDTVIAAAIVVAAHLLAPRQKWASRAHSVRREAESATRSYEAEAPYADTWRQAELRRTAYSLLAQARTAVDHADAEWFSSTDWSEVRGLIRDLEMRCDSVTASILPPRPMP